MRRKKVFEAISIAFFLAISMIMVLTSTIPTAYASPSSSTAKPLHFYFHYVPTPQYIANYTYAHEIMNTTQSWGPLQRIGPQSGIFDIYFYLYPNLAGNCLLNGTFWVHLWVNATGATPSAVFTFTIYELNASGFNEEGSWTTGSEDLSPNIYDVNGIPGNAPLLFTIPSYTFHSGSSVVLQITLKPGAATAVSVWYDTAQYPSQVIMYSEDYARVSSVLTYDGNNTETNMFPYNVSEGQRKVVVRANVTDPFGGYDIYMVNMTIFNPLNQSVLDNVNMTRISDGLWAIQYLHTYETNWSYPETAMQGNYTVKVSVVDNNGYYQFLDYGFFDPYIEHGYHIFNIGIVVLYNPTFKVFDDVDDPLPEAQVYIKWPNGTLSPLPTYTDNNGFFNLEQVHAANYTFTIWWKSIIVQQTTVYVDSDGPYTIKCRVYQLTVRVLGNNWAPVHGAYAVIYSEAGTVYDFKMTSASGEAISKLPEGKYRIEILYSTTYWLTAVTTNATEPSKSITSTDTVTITLAEFPPPIWTTTGFLILVAFIIIGTLGIVAFLYVRRRPLKKTA